LSYRTIVCSDIHLGERLTLVELDEQIYFSVQRGNGDSFTGCEGKFIPLDLAALRAFAAVLENDLSIGRVALSDERSLVTVPRERASLLLAIVSESSQKILHASLLSKGNRRTLCRGIVHARAILRDEALLEECAHDLSSLVKEMA